VIFNKIKKLWVTDEEQLILETLEGSGLKSMKVLGRGTLTVDPKEVSSTAKFKEYAKQVDKIIDAT
jgi:hypothetical protein